MLTIQGTGSSGAGPTMASTKHRAAFVDTRIHDEKIVIFGEHVLVNEMHASFLRGGAYLVTVHDKASVLLCLLISYNAFACRVFKTNRFLSSRASCIAQRVMILLNVELQKMVCRKILAAFGTAIGMLLCVVNFKIFKGRECQGFVVGRKRAFHRCRSAV